MEKLWGILMRYLARDVFHVFTSDDILRDWRWKGEKLAPETIEKLREEATQLKDSLLWKVLKSEVQWRALKTLVEDGKSAHDLDLTRQIGHVITVIDEKLVDIAG